MIGEWTRRRWAVAAVVAFAFSVLVAIPTVLIENPWFSRDIPVTWWAWPALIVSSLLAGLLAATYVRQPDDETDPEVQDRAAQTGWVGGLLTFFAVGCPVCNKLVLVVLGYAGAITWFAPIQPFLQLTAIGLLAWGLHLRLRSERECPTAVT